MLDELQIVQYIIALTYIPDLDVYNLYYLYIEVRV